MQFPEMVAFNHILRSQSSLLLNPSKFNILHPSINSLIHLNQNPNFSRHSRLIHSNTCKLSPEWRERDIEYKPRGWSVYDSTESYPRRSSYGRGYPRNEIKSENSGRKVESTGKPRLSSVFGSTESNHGRSYRRKEIKYDEREVESMGNRVNVSEANSMKVTPQEAVIEAKSKVCSVSGSTESYPRNVIKSENSVRDVESTGSRVDVSEANSLEVPPQELDIEAKPRVWSVFGSTESNPINVIKPENSEREVEGNRVDESETNSLKVTPQEPVVEAKPMVWSDFGLVDPRNVTKSENSEREVECMGNRVYVSEEAEIGSWSLAGKGKTGKSKVNWVCSNCGHSYGQWWGTCISCKEGGTLKRFSVENERSDGYEISENVMKSYPRNVIKYENSEREVESTGNRVDVSEANSMKVTPQGLDIEAKPRVWSVFGSTESNPTNVIKPENSEREVEGNRVDESEANSLKITPEKPVIEAKPSVWSVFGSVFSSKESNRTNVIKPENSGRDVEGNRVDESEANSLKVTPQEVVIEAKPSVCSVFSLTDPRTVTKSETSEREVESMGNRVDVSEANSMKVTPQEPDIEANPRVWSVSGSTESYPRNVIKSENSEREVESTGAPEGLSSNVVESVVSPEEPNSEAKPRVCSVLGGSTESYPRNVTKSENSERKVESTGAPEGLSSNVVESVVSPGEPNSEAKPGVWSFFGSKESYPRNVTKSENSEREVESAGTREGLSSNVVDNVVSPEEPNNEAKPGVWSVFGSTKSQPRNVTKSENCVRKVESTGNRVYVSEEQEIASWSLPWKGKTGKSKVHWVCSNCGHSHGQWWGTCQSCKEAGTVKECLVENERSGGRVSGYEISENVMKKSWLPEKMVGQNPPVRLTEVNRGMNHLDWRIRLSGPFGLEVNRVLGSGVVPGSLILIGGDPGVGKSTLALQMAALISGSCDVGGSAPVIYVSGEESVEQIGNRADRLSIDTKDLFLHSGTDVDDILEQVQVLSPRALVVDSIQTVYVKGVAGGPGSTAQVKECTSTLLRYAKRTKVPVVLIGHVTKTGDLAGPRILEHIVDVVLYMEGEKHSTNRLLRSVKNRFGSTDELGIFQMLESGLEAVSNPSEMFLSQEYSDSDHLVGLAVAVVLDGSRTFLIEVQALCVSGSGLYVTSIPVSRAEMIISVLRKQAGLKLGDNSIFLNVISGVYLKETSGDLALAAAICSSFLELPLPNNVAFIGEIGLGGELRMVPRIEKRVHTLAKLGYKKCVVPFSAKKALSAISSEIEIVGCKNLKEVIDNVFRKED